MDYRSRKAYGEGARVRVYYQLVRSAPWPQNIHAAITTEAKRRKVKLANARDAVGSDGAQ